MVPDFRDTQYWRRMTEEEKQNYLYLVNKTAQSQSDVEFIIDGRTPSTPEDLVMAMHVALRATTDLWEYEKTLLLKYWHATTPGSSTVQ